MCISVLAAKARAALCTRVTRLGATSEQKLHLGVGGFYAGATVAFMSIWATGTAANSPSV